MPLALHPNPASAPARRKTDHLGMNGQVEVGRIYKRDTPNKSDSQWLWAINGVPLAAAGVTLQAHDLGGSNGRSVWFDPREGGQIRVRAIGSSDRYL